MRVAVRCLMMGMALWGTVGCGATTRTARLAGMPEAMCRHCNCLMPAGTDPHAICKVCDCGKAAHQCMRGR